MKAFAFAIITACLVIIAVILNSIFLGILLENLINECQSIPDKCESLSDYEQLYQRFKDLHKFISLTVSHEELSEVERDFAEIIGAAKADDKESLIIAKSRLVTTLSHLRRLSLMNIDSVF